MKLDDSILGPIIAVLGIILAAYSSRFPTVAGMRFGPGLFPTVVGAGLILCGSAIGIRRLVVLRKSKEAVANAGWPFARRADGIAKENDYVRPLVVCVIVVLFAFAINPLGFIPAAILVVTALFVTFGMSILKAAVISVPVVFAIHFVFYTLLGVPLPWGVLLPIAW